MFEVTFIKVFAAGVASLIVGFVWYHPRVFGGIWMSLSQITTESLEKGKRRMPISALSALLAGMLAAYVMNYFGIAWGVYDVIGAIELGFWCWLGFVATTMIGTVLWEQKPFTLYVLHAAHWLVSFIVMAIVLVF
jgi:hypothetical protein